MTEENHTTATVHHLIVHTIIENEHQFSVRERSEELPRSALAQELVDQLHAEYRGKHKKSHGGFDGDDGKSPAQKNIKEYVDGDGSDFLAFSKLLVKQLCDKMQRTSARGGHVFVAHITAESHAYLLVAIVTDSTAIALNQTQNLQATVHLDVKGFRFAGRVDIDAWNSNKDRYVSFLKGSKDAADYFRDFLGCTTARAEVTDTKRLVSIVRDFAKTALIDGKPLTLEERGSLFAKVDAKCRELASASTPLDFQTFCNEMWPSDSDALAIALEQSAEPLNDGFVPNSRGLTGLIHYRGKSKQWTVEFERDALNDGSVFFDPEKDTLTLSNLPAELIERLRDDMPSDNDG